MDLRELFRRHFESFYRFRVLLCMLCGSIALFGCYLIYLQFTNGADPGSSTLSFALPGGGSISIQTGFVGVILVALSLCSLWLMLRLRPRIEVIRGDHKITLTHNRSPYDPFDQHKIDKMDHDSLDDLQDLSEDDFKK